MAHEIQLSGVTMEFSNGGGAPLVVFDRLTIAIPAGQVVAIVGPSGCGKTTLLNLLAGLLAPTAGTISGSSTSLGYLFQRDALLPWRTALDNAVVGLECRGVRPAEAVLRARELFSRFGLAGFENAWPRTLSGGQRQRVALIQSLLVDPEVLLLDEPFGSLDYQTKLVLEDELLGVLENGGGRKTVVFVTHDIEEAIVLGDRILVLGQPGRGILLDVPVPLPREGRSAVDTRQEVAVRDLFRRCWQGLQLPRHSQGKDQRVHA